MKDLPSGLVLPDWVRNLHRRRRVADMLEEMAPDLLRINASAAETAARIMVRLRS